MRNENYFAFLTRVFVLLIRSLPLNNILWISYVGKLSQSPSEAIKIVLSLT